MKNTNYIINGVLAVAVIILFILYFTGKGGGSEKHTGAVMSDSISAELPIAYIDIDSLLNNYNYFKDLSNTLMDKREKSTVHVNSKAKELQKEFMDFQAKAQINAFISPERRQQEEERLARKDQELQELAAKAQEELELERMKLNLQMSDTIVASLKVYNETRKYQVIFSKQGTNPFIIANEAYDITADVIKFLNDRYVPKEK
jgi:outer membrane protein